jgi:hypothetical protein
MAEDLFEALAALDGAPSATRNARFARRLRDLIREWLTGLMDVSFDGEFAERRQSLGQRLVRLDLSFQDLVLLEAMASRRLFSLAFALMDGRPQELSLAVRTLNTAILYDRALIYAGFVELHDRELEQALLERFLSITGFSPSLYEGLAETWERNQDGPPPTLS